MSVYQHDYAYRVTTDSGIFTISGLTFDESISLADKQSRHLESQGFRYLRHYQQYRHFDAVRWVKLEIISPEGKVYNA